MSKTTIVRESGGGAVYCLGIIGALVYYFQRADSFTDYIVGILKALVWPALLVYQALERF